MGLHSSQQNDNRGGREKKYWDPAGIWRPGSSRKNSNHLRVGLTGEVFRCCYVSKRWLRNFDLEFISVCCFGVGK